MGFDVITQVKTFNAETQQSCGSEWRCSITMIWGNRHCIWPQHLCIVTVIDEAQSCNINHILLPVHATETTQHHLLTDYCYTSINRCTVTSVDNMNENEIINRRIISITICLYCTMVISALKSLKNKLHRNDKIMKHRKYLSIIATVAGTRQLEPTKNILHSKSMNTNANRNDKKQNYQNRED